MAALEDIGPYRVVREIGAGGMGAVFEGIHRDTGARCAIKTQRSDVAGVHGLRALRREVQVLANLDHPHIVKVLDFDLEAAEPWFAMEYIEGRPMSDWHRSSAETFSSADTILEVASRTSVADWDALDDALEEARTQLFSLPDIAPTRAIETPAPASWEPSAELRTKLAWLGQIARALQFLHGLSIVHGDVKPGNVLIRNDGLAVLVDFGLVSRTERRLSRTALERSRTQAQTLEYASPERIRTAEYDSRADLYALGCMLYELFADDPPFVGNPAAVAVAHVITPPPPLVELEEPVPPGLEALIHELLEKDPVARTPYAAHVRAVLEDHGVPTTAPGHPLPRALPYLHPPVPVAFEREFAQVKAALATVGQPGQPSALRVVGPAGSGKSRFVLQAMSLAAQRRFDVRVIEAVDSDERTVFAAFAPVVRDLADRAVAGEWTPGPSAVWLALLEPRLERYLEAELRQTLADIKTGAASDPSDAIARAIVQGIRDVAGSQPVLLVVEQLDELDRGSHIVLDLVARRAAEEPWFVLGTRRADGPAADHCIVLPPLGPVEVQNIVAQMLGTAPQEVAALASILGEAAQGRPGKIVALVHALLDHELIEQDGRGHWRGAQGASLDEAARTLLERTGADPRGRVDLLPDRLRRLGGAAAVLGRRFDPDDVGWLVGVGTQRASLAFSELMRLGFVGNVDAVGRPAADRMSFATRDIRRAFYDALDDDERRGFHLAVARKLGEESADPAAVARHWERGGDERKAFDAWSEAAQHAAERFAHDSRADCLRRAARLGSWLSREAREAMLADSLESLAEGAETPAVVREASLLLSELTTTPARVRVAAALSKRATIGEQPELIAPYEAELSAAAEHADPATRRIAAAATGQMALAAGQFERALEYTRAAMRAAKEDGTLTLQALAADEYAVVLFSTGKVTEAIRWFREAVRLAEEGGDAERVRRASAHMSTAMMQMGLFRDSRAQALAGVDFYRRAQMPWEVLVSIWNVSVCDCEVGRFDVVGPAVDELEALRRQLGLEDDDAPYIGMRGRALSALGHHEEALRLARRAVACARTEKERSMQERLLAAALLNAGRPGEADAVLRPPPVQSSLYVRATWGEGRGRIATLLGDYDAAEEVLRSTSKLAEGGALQQVARCDAGLGRLRIAQGRTDEGRQFLRAALDWFDRQDYFYDASLARIALAGVEPESAGELLQPVRAYIASQRFEADAAIVRELRAVER